jgi:hypothetical protein
MLEKSLGDIPVHVSQIRELITRFEVCHFKYLHHLENIRKSIMDLKPYTNPGDIGQNHIQHGEEAWKSDKTGRAMMGQQYLWSLHNWLYNNEKNKSPEYNDELGRELDAWLGEKTPEKARLVRLLLARLKWDWQSLERISQKSMEKISREDGEKDLEYQIHRMDICHFAFPVNLINVIRGIGKMEPVDNFEGCGIFNSSIRKSIRAELLNINDWLLNRQKAGIPYRDQEEMARIWLFACLAKTIKEQVGLTDPVVLPAVS